MLRERAINLSYNITIIEAFWKKAHNGLGENCVSIKDDDSIYSSLEKSKETLRQMKRGEIDISRAAYSKWAIRLENKTGISTEFLKGDKRIQLGDLVDKKLGGMFDVFIEACEQIDGINDNADRKNMGFAKSKLEEYIKSKNKSERAEIKATVIRAKDGIDTINQYNRMLKSEVDLLINKGIVEIADKESYRAIYYVVNGKPASLAAMTTPDDLIDLLEKISAKDMWKLGEEKLKKLCAALERDVELARAVLKIGNEIEKFK